MQWQENELGESDFKKLHTRLLIKYRADSDNYIGWPSVSNVSAYCPLDHMIINHIHSHHGHVCHRSPTDESQSSLSSMNWDYDSIMWSVCPPAVSCYLFQSLSGDFFFTALSFSHGESTISLLQMWTQRRLLFSWGNYTDHSKQHPMGFKGCFQGLNGGR